MSLKDAYKKIYEILRPELEPDVQDFEKLSQNIEELLDLYTAMREAADANDSWYLKRTVQWLLQMFEASSRPRDFDYSKYPQQVGKLFDTVYDAVTDDRIDGVIPVQTTDRDIAQVVRTPKDGLHKEGKDEENERPKFLVVE
jgi:hypothetical protein